MLSVFVEYLRSRACRRHCAHMYDVLAVGRAVNIILTSWLFHGGTWELGSKFQNLRLTDIDIMHEVWSRNTHIRFAHKHALKTTQTASVDDDELVQNRCNRGTS